MGFSRVVTGMHSWVDVWGGWSLGLLLFATWWGFLGGALESWIIEGGWSVPLGVGPLIVMLLYAHPDPEGPCPCFEDTVAFVAVVGGVIWGSASHMALGLSVDDQPTSFVHGFLRLVVGVAIIFVFRKTTKNLVKHGLQQVEWIFEKEHVPESKTAEDENKMKASSSGSTSVYRKSPIVHRIPRFTAKFVTDTIVYFEQQDSTSFSNIASTSFPPTTSTMETLATDSAGAAEPVDQGNHPTLEPTAAHPDHDPSCSRPSVRKSVMESARESVLNARQKQQESGETGASAEESSAEADVDVTVGLDLSVALSPAQAVKLNKLAEKAKMAMALKAMKSLGRTMDNSESTMVAMKNERDEGLDDAGLRQAIDDFEGYMLICGFIKGQKDYEDLLKQVIDTSAPENYEYETLTAVKRASVTHTDEELGLVDVTGGRRGKTRGDPDRLKGLFSWNDHEESTEVPAVSYAPASSALAHDLDTSFLQKVQQSSVIDASSEESVVPAGEEAAEGSVDTKAEKPAPPSARPQRSSMKPRTKSVPKPEHEKPLDEPVSSGDTKNSHEAVHREKKKLPPVQCDDRGKPEMDPKVNTTANATVFCIQPIAP
ncbi:Sphingosine-1-phosphate phosphatase 2 [Chytridiales sp. JEL 0842]|nr:Sphingosine-1-phosphate phosphatase 2 [Chytridiales sp. JEL 0842]